MNRSDAPDADLPEISSSSDCHCFSFVIGDPSVYFHFNERLQPSPLMFMRHPLSEDKLTRLRDAGVPNVDALRDIIHFNQFLHSTSNISTTREQHKILARTAFALLAYDEQMEISNHIHAATGVQPHLIIRPPQADHPDLPV